MQRLLIPTVLIAGVIASSTGHAETATHGKTRAQVRAELVQARAAGLFDAPDASYPSAHLHAAATPRPAPAIVGDAGASDMGSPATSRSQSGRRTVTAPAARDSIYFGQ
jgi:hypothetical protein